MHHWSKIRLLPVLTLLLYPAAATAVILPGESRFGLSRSQPSQIGVDLRQLGADLCQSLLLPSRMHVVGRCPIPSQGECVLKIGAPGTASPVPIGNTLTKEAASGGTFLPSVEGVFVAWRTAPWVAPGLELLRTSCGSWRYELVFVVESPRSMLTLAPETDRTLHGDFDGDLHLSTRLRFFPVSGGRVVEMPLDLSLSLTGSWAALPAVPTSLSLEGVSNLILFVDLENGEWIDRPACAEGDGSLLCFEALPEAVDALNAEPPPR